MAQAPNVPQVIATQAKQPSYSFAMKTSARKTSFKRRGVQDYMECIFRHPNSENLESIIEMFMDEILTTEKLDSQIPIEDGRYTWIIIESHPNDKNPDDNFYAGRAISDQECGTLHKNLELYAGRDKGRPVTIYSAGEFKKAGGKLVFNFLSGSYMLKKVMNMNSAEEERFKRRAKEDFKRTFRALSDLKVMYTSKDLFPLNVVHPTLKRNMERLRHFLPHNRANIHINEIENDGRPVSPILQNENNEIDLINRNKGSKVQKPTINKSRKKSASAKPRK